MVTVQACRKSGNGDGGGGGGGGGCGGCQDLLQYFRPMS